MGSHSLLQWIFSTQGLNLGLLHCRQILYHQRSPKANSSDSELVIPFEEQNISIFDKPACSNLLLLLLVPKLGPELCYYLGVEGHEKSMFFFLFKILPLICIHVRQIDLVLSC